MDHMIGQSREALLGPNVLRILFTPPMPCVQLQNQAEFGNYSYQYRNVGTQISLDTVVSLYYLS